MSYQTRLQAEIRTELNLDAKGIEAQVKARFFRSGKREGGEVAHLLRLSIEPPPCIHQDHT